MNTKIKSQKTMAAIRRRLRKKRIKVVFTNGCFDIIHVGHVTYLRKARALGDVLIVGLNTDASVRRLKGPLRPVVPERERAEILSAFEMVDYVVLFNDDTPAGLIQALEPDVLVKGSDWQINQIAGKDTVQKYGGQIRRIPLVKGRSTTTVIERIRHILAT